MTAPRLVLVPGLGADSRLFAPQFEAFPGLEVPPWIPPRDRETLRDYAARLAASVRPGRVVIGGASFGGMLATEMARHLDAAAVIQIGSCRHPSQISRAFVSMERNSRVAPDMVIRAGLALAPGVIDRVLGPVTREQRDVLLAMAREIAVPFIRWAARAIMEWPGAPEAHGAVPVVAIHGTRDRVIPFRRIRAAGEVEAIDGAGHVPSLTHGEAVNAFIRRVLASGVT
jgi:pimeloyl-ACP methyl ester carboxylesterase